MAAPPTPPRHTSTFRIPGMDCPSEERLIRMALEPLPGVHALHFDLEGRRLAVVHEGPADPILEGLGPLDMGAALESTVESEPLLDDRDTPDPAAERRVLRQLLAINGLMFVLELGVGLAAQSTGLIGDGLDMLADAMVYGLALGAVGRGVGQQRRAARASGVLQLLLALGLLGEVARRAVVGSAPVEALMIGTAAVALAANLACVALLARHREGGLHLKASWIFTTNDALVNLGVIAAGVLVAWTDAAWPDLIIGAAVGLLVLRGAVRILRLR